MTFTVGDEARITRIASLAGQPGHLQIHQHDVGLQAAHGFARFVAVGRFADDDELLAVVEQRAQAFAHDAVIVDQQQADGRGCARVMAYRQQWNANAYGGPLSRLRLNFTHAAERGGALAHGLQADALFGAIGVGRVALARDRSRGRCRCTVNVSTSHSMPPQMSTRFAPEWRIAFDSASRQIRYRLSSSAGRLRAIGAEIQADARRLRRKNESEPLQRRREAHSLDVGDADVATPESAGSPLTNRAAARATAHASRRTRAAPALRCDAPDARLPPDRGATPTRATATSS